MKIMNKIISYLTSFVLIFLFAASPVLAQSNSPKNSKSISILPADKTVNGDYFAAGQTVEIYGTVNGDVYAAGSNLIIDGTVTGDVLAAGGNITISGKVLKNVRMVGGQLNVSGTIGKNLSVAGGNINLEKNSVIDGNAVLAAGNVTLSGAINQGVEAAVGNLRVAPSASVKNDLNYFSKEKASIDPQAVISGKVNHRETPNYQPPQINKQQLIAVLASIFIGFKILSIFTSLIIGLVIINWFPKYTALMNDTLNKRPWFSLIVGLIFLVVTPIILLILGLTIVGLPLALILFILYCLVTYFGRILFMYWLGITVFGLFGKQVINGWAVVVGIIVFALISLITPLGFILSIGGIFGLGAAVASKKNLYDSLRKKNLI